jgi:hypothetical protein
VTFSTFLLPSSFVSCLIFSSSQRSERNRFAAASAQKAAEEEAAREAAAEAKAMAARLADVRASFADK